MLNGLKECMLENYTEFEFRLIPPTETNESFFSFNINIFKGVGLRGEGCCINKYFTESILERQLPKME